MKDHDYSGLELYKDGKLTLLGYAHLLYVSKFIVSNIAHLVFNYKKEGDYKDEEESN